MSYMTNNEVIEYIGLPESVLDDIATLEGDEYVAVQNQVLSAIVNKILYQTVEGLGFENPFERFFSFDIRFGDTIENVYVDLPDGYKFDKDATDPFSKKTHVVHTLYATINYQMQYQITIEAQLLKRAVLSEFGLNRLINEIMRSAMTKKSLDEYFAVIRMLNNEDLYKNGFEEIEYDSDTDSKYDVAKLVTETIVNKVTDFAFPTKDNNKIGVMNAAARSDILLIIRQDILNSINLDYLAGVFNLQKVDLIKNIIAVRDFRVSATDDDALSPTYGQQVTVGDNLAFIIMDSRAFDMHRALQDAGSIYNPKGLYSNNFQNSWNIFSVKQWYNMAAFMLTDTATPAGSET